MNNIDLNIDNYNLNDFLNIFKITNINNKTENIYKINSKLNKAKEKLPTDIYGFYKKVGKIITTLTKLIEGNIANGERDYLKYINKIKNVENFELYEENELTNKILNRLSDKQYIFEFNESNADTDKNLNINVTHPLINDKNSTNIVANSFPNVVAPGYLNPVKRITQNQNINLNSCFRHNYYQTNPCDFLYMFPSEIKNVLSLRLVSIEIPNSWYLFSHLQKNNIFKIEVNVNDCKDTYTIVIPDGNYDSDSLQSFLNYTYFYESKLETYLKYIKFSIDQYNFRTRFEILENEFDHFSFTINFVDSYSQNIMNSCGWILGFRLANYVDISDKIQSEGLFDGGGDRYIYVALNDYQYNNNSINTVCFDKSILNENVIAKIPMVNGKLSLIVSDDNNPLSKLRRYTGPVNISRIHIKILDKFGNIIDLNNMDYSLTLEMELLYECFNFKNVSV